MPSKHSGMFDEVVASLRERRTDQEKVCAGSVGGKHHLQDSCVHASSVSGKMNAMVWGKRCWFSNTQTSFPIPNMMHFVLSTTLE